VEEFLKLNCLFYQHSHVFKTGSNGFFKELLNQLGYEVHSVSRDDFNLNQVDGFDLVVLFQADNLIGCFEGLEIPVLIIPMLDEALHQTSDFFRHSRNFQYLSFSKDLHQFLTLSGNNSIYLQYWPEIPIHTSEKIDRVFFWERTPVHVSLSNVQSWFRNSDLVISIRQHWDPNHSGTEYQGNSMQVELLASDWLDRSTFEEILASSKVFIAPRRWEGIGMSSLEAMAHGNAVVGIDSPALRDYVIDGKNGVLIKTWNKDRSLPPINWERLGQQAKKQAIKGRRRFERKALKKIRISIEKAAKVKSKKHLPLIPRRLTLRKFIFLKDFQR
jgi:hypothetical protein